MSTDPTGPLPPAGGSNSIKQVINTTGTSLTIVNGDGNTVTRKGDAPWRNNNPGNLRASNWTQSQPGFVGVSNGFAVFSTVDAGFAAQASLLFNNKNYTGLTLAQAITKYAPPNENNTAAYIKTVSSAMGISPDTPMSSLSPAQQQAMVKSMVGVEGYTTGLKNGKIISGGNTSPAPQPAPGPAPSPSPSPGPAEPATPPPPPSPSRVAEFFPVNIGPNVLHNYADYTYGISIHLLTAEDYNKLKDSPGSYTPKNVIVASGGRRNTTDFARNEYFNEDLFIDDVEFMTIIGMGDSNRSTNALQLKFKIIEPYGMTFIDRINQATWMLGHKNHTQAPYVFQIDFFGNTDSGNLKMISECGPKRIPIQILNMTCKVTDRGSEYTVSAIPYNHQAFNDTIGKTPTTINVTAKNLSDFFRNADGGTNDLKTTKSTDQREAQKENVVEAPATINSDSLTNGINSWFATLLSKNTISQLPEYRFDFDKDIIGGSAGELKSTAVVVAQKIPMAVADQLRSSSFISNLVTPNKSETKVTPGSEAKSDVQVYTIPGGTSIEAVINSMVKSSKYFLDQIANYPSMTDEQYKKAVETNTVTPIRWIKIIPKVEILKFDEKTNLYAKRITYRVEPSNIANGKIEAAPSIDLNQQTVSKQYKYMYTGQNTDILSLDIDFNMAYLLQTTALKQSLTSYGAQTAASQVSNDQPANSSLTQPPGPDSLMRMGIVSDHGAKGMTVINTPTCTDESDANDILRNITTSAGSDMINVKMKIIGDPSFIQQDDVLFNNTNTDVDTANPHVTPNGSIKTSNAIYVWISFLTPVDVDEANGMMKFDEFKSNKFSGVYQILTVDNVFKGGKFEQTLNLIRIQNQQRKAVKPNDSLKQREVAASASAKEAEFQLSLAAVNTEAAGGVAGASAATLSAQSEAAMTAATAKASAVVEAQAQTDPLAAMKKQIAAANTVPIQTASPSLPPTP